MAALLAVLFFAVLAVGLFPQMAAASVDATSPEDDSTTIDDGSEETEDATAVDVSDADESSQVSGGSILDEVSAVADSIKGHDLSAYFSRSEFDKNGEMPDACLAILQQFCQTVLDPFREQVGALIVTSGYRSPAENGATGGIQTSFHVYTENHCAADVVSATGADLAEMFGWLCQVSGLPFDKAILETQNGKPACIHIQYQSAFRRLAYLGQTHGTSGYTSYPVGSSEA